jgi:hypothetical protein
MVRGPLHGVINFSGGGEGGLIAAEVSLNLAPFFL